MNKQKIIDELITFVRLGIIFVISSLLIGYSLTIPIGCKILNFIAVQTAVIAIASFLFGYFDKQFGVTGGILGLFLPNFYRLALPYKPMTWHYLIWFVIINFILLIFCGKYGVQQREKQDRKKMFCP